ncbi:MAG TPA: DUF5671 domain-containing protein [Ktedonobacteraceae bacterium]
MARNLYRFYLYTIFIALVVFAVVVTAQLLGTLFEFTPLGEPNNTLPSQAEVVQSLVFAIVGWVISGALGGFHYWLIRRDQQQEPLARSSAIRAFFLNTTEAIGMLIVIPLVGFSALGSWAYGYNANNATLIGTALPVFLLVIGLELERRRFQEHTTLAWVFQRLHFFSMQLISLAFVIGAFMSGFRPLVDLALFGGRGECADGYCQTHQVAGLVVQLLWFSAAWLVYSLVTERDSSRLVRVIMHGIGLALGLGLMLYGIFELLNIALLPLFHMPPSFNDVLGVNAAHDFVSPLAVGLLSTITYHLLLRSLARRGMITQKLLLLIEETSAALLSAGLFWWGCGFLLYNLLQTITPAPAGPDAQNWVVAIALLISGLAYIPLDLLIRRSFKLDPASAIGPRRSLVLALLAVGILALAIGGATALYAWGTALLGSPLDNWPQFAHSGLAATTVGIALVAIYIWPLRGEHLLARPVRAEEPPAPEPAQTSGIIEGILDELLAGQITREEAAARIHALQDTAIVPM